MPLQKPYLGYVGGGSTTIYHLVYHSLVALPDVLAVLARQAKSWSSCRLSHRRRVDGRHSILSTLSHASVVVCVGKFDDVIVSEISLK